MKCVQQKHGMSAIMYHVTPPEKKNLVHVGPDKSMNSCDAIYRIVDCTLEQIGSPSQRVVCADGILDYK